VTLVTDTHRVGVVRRCARRPVSASSRRTTTSRVW
jgi:hypothetical protein